MPKPRAIPHSEEAEMGAVGCLLHQPVTVGEIFHSMGITPEHFYNESLRTIYCAVIETTALNKPVDFMLITTYLRDTKRLDKLAVSIKGQVEKGACLITTLFTLLDSPAQAAHYAQELVTKLAFRRAIAFMEAGTNRLYEEQNENPIDIANGVISNLETVGQKDSDRFKSITPSIVESINDRIEARAMGASIEGVQTGIHIFDKEGGLLPATYYVTAAAEKVGKTAMCESIVTHLVKHGKRALVFQRDMSVQKMVARIACRMAGVIFEDYHRNQLQPEDAIAFRKALKSIDPDLLRIHSPADMTSRDMIAIARHEQRKGAIAVCFLDVFTRLYVPGKDYVLGLARASDEIRQSATDGLTWWILAHVSHESEKRDGRPKISDLKWCKGLAGDCDKFGLMWSDEDPRKEENRGQRQHIIYSVDANRDGESGDEHMYFDRPYMTFYSTRTGPL